MDRLDDIKKHYDTPNYGKYRGRYYCVSDADYEWLINVAEAAADLNDIPDIESGDFSDLNRLLNSTD